jgi:probable phosphoglycerate mutase
VKGRIYLTRIGIIRHGRTKWNLEGKAQGHSDIPLDQDGLSDAKELAERLSAEEWDVIFSSPLMRAKQTAEAIGMRKKIEILYDDRLLEVSGGQIEGTTEAERVTKWGKEWYKLDLGIEKSDVVLSRGLSFIEDIINVHPEKNILIVSHGSFIKHLLKELVPQLNNIGSLKNTSLTILNKTNQFWDVELYNCTQHVKVRNESIY